MAKAKTESCGSCDFETKNPKVISAKTKVVNVKVAFADALKLKTAIDECVLRLNRCNRSFREGRKSRMRLVVYFDKKRIQILGPKA